MKNRIIITLFSCCLLMMAFFVSLIVDNLKDSDTSDLLSAAQKANSDEKKVVAIVEGKEIYQETIDFLAKGEEISLKNTPSTTSDSVTEVDKEEILKKQIRNAVVLAEAERLNLTATEEEAEKYTNENYNMVKNVGGQPYELILDYMKAMNMSEDEYLEKSAEINRNMLTRAKLYDKFVEGKSGSYDELVAEYEKYVDDLIKKADIEYKD